MSLPTTGQGQILITITINAAMKSKAFREGMAAFSIGLPLQDNYGKDQWFYERGRQFAAATRLESLNITNGKVLLAQQKLYAELRKDGSIR